jgi:hypothetical protein
MVMRRTGRARLAALVVLIPILALSAGSRAAASDDWARFRGPNGSGVGEASGLPVEFGPENNVDWQAEVPFGRSSPAVGERQIFLTGIEGDKLTVLALDRDSGKEAWRRVFDRAEVADLHEATDSSTPSPVTDGTNVYAFFHEFGLISYDASGKERWRKPLGPFLNFYGIAASPILAGDRLIMICDQSQGSFLVAVNKDTGRAARGLHHAHPARRRLDPGLWLALGRCLRPRHRRCALAARRCRLRSGGEPGGRRRPALPRRGRSRVEYPADLQQAGRRSRR